jgi:predicted GNAT superfamily acetyltransferase
MLRNYYYFYGLFNDAVNNSGSIASNDRMIHEWWVGKDVEESGRGLI